MNVNGDLTPMLREFMTLADSTYVFEIERPVPSPEKTLSKTSLEHLEALVMMWITTRMMRAWQEHNEAPQALRVTVTVETR